MINILCLAVRIIRWELELSETTIPAKWSAIFVINGLWVPTKTETHWIPVAYAWKNTLREEKFGVKMVKSSSWCSSKKNNIVHSHFWNTMTAFKSKLSIAESCPLACLR